ncbi:MAG: YceI family protein [Acidimicrobiales bacterium]|nr:YceI family protein [Acidimicrobiales bacterium]
MSTTTTTNPTLAAGPWMVDPAHSEVGFTVRHLGMSKVRGRFNEFEGAVTIADDLATSSLTVSVNLASVDTNNADRDGHLQTGDFFDVETQPQMTFRSTSVSDDALMGDITIKGITRPVQFDLEFHGVTVDHYAATRAGFSATGQISRSDFGIDFNAPFGLDGVLLSDKINIELEIQLVPQQ